MKKKPNKNAYKKQKNRLALGVKTELIEVTVIPCAENKRQKENTAKKEKEGNERA